MKRFLGGAAAASAIFSAALLAVSCGGGTTDTPPAADTRPPAENSTAAPTANGTEDALPANTKATPDIPNLQAEILDNRFGQTTAPLGSVDFRNFTYPLPRGWENPDNSDITLTDGRLNPVSADTDLGMDPAVVSERKAARRIGASYVTTRYFDVTGDGEDEAIVVIKLETTGSAIPQVVYVFTRKAEQPQLIWSFRTGDRADGGLKNLRAENGEIIVELYGQDRYILGTTETAEISGDKEQLCCPTFFTSSRYKWNGTEFRLQGKRLTYSVADPTQPAVENMIEAVQKQDKQKAANK